MSIGDREKIAMLASWVNIYGYDTTLDLSDYTVAEKIIEFLEGLRFTPDEIHG